MAAWRILICILVSLALVGAGLSGRGAVNAGAEASTDDAPLAMSARAPCQMMTAANECSSCDDGTCPLSQPECAASCAISAPMMALAGTAAMLPLVFAHPPSESAAQLTAGRDLRPDPFPPRV